MVGTGREGSLSVRMGWLPRAQREQGWWARAGKVACLGGWGRWLHVVMRGGVVGEGGDSALGSKGAFSVPFHRGAPCGKSEREASRWPSLHGNAQSQYLLFLKALIQCAVSGFLWSPNPLQGKHNVNSHILITSSASH